VWNKRTNGTAMVTGLLWQWSHSSVFTAKHPLMAMINKSLQRRFPLLQVQHLGVCAKVLNISKRHTVTLSSYPPQYTVEVLHRIVGSRQSAEWKCIGDLFKMTPWRIGCAPWDLLLTWLTTVSFIQPICDSSVTELGPFSSPLHTV